MRFSALAADFPGTTNRLYARVHELREKGIGVVDLIRGNVQEAGIVFPDPLLRDILDEAVPLARTYKPDSLGQKVAREAIASYEDNRADRILLTPGTSVSYWYAFRLLAEPGDEILCPAPSYPLLDYIARMTGVTLTSYDLDESRGWRIDFADLERRIEERTRAIVLISPHNPTGMVATPSEVETLGELARRHDLAIVADEVFREFVYGDGDTGRPAGTGAPLVFTLNGFSKMFALPGMKIGWISVSGDPSPVDTAMKTLEMISDTFLPVNEIAQFSVPGIFRFGRNFLDDYRNTIRSLRNSAMETIGIPAGVAPKGGFYCVVPFGREIDDESLAIEIATQEHLLIHPGYFYEIEGHHIVFSFVGNEERVHTGLERLAAHL